jgi:hypothetical protein
MRPIVNGTPGHFFFLPTSGRQAACRTLSAGTMDGDKGNVHLQRDEGMLDRV